ncbi:hypothetical protein [Streptomyces sp. NPDC058279]|uniref:hypothetical protein n=1 Tax=Streptomyces sp. NPDC058279 TaxID=3346418 RepID=UPI0036E95301
MNVPAARSFTARVAPAVGDPTPTGLIAWNLLTLESRDVHGCSDDIRGCTSS